MNTYLSCSVLNIKRVVKREIKINQDYVCLHYQDREVKDHLTLEDQGIAEIIIGKQRNGPIGTVRLSFIGRLTKFENLASDVYSEFG